MADLVPVPSYMIAGARPVKVELAENGAKIFAVFDWQTGEFLTDDKSAVWAYDALHMRAPEDSVEHVDDHVFVTKEIFDQVVERLREKISAKSLAKGSDNPG